MGRDDEGLFDLRSKVGCHIGAVDFSRRRFGSLGGDDQERGKEPLLLPTRKMGNVPSVPLLPKAAAKFPMIALSGRSQEQDWTAEISDWTVSSTDRSFSLKSNAL